LLLVVVGFVAPGTAYAHDRDIAPDPFASHAGSVGSHRPDFTSVVIRQGVDVDDSRSEKAGCGQRRVFAGNGLAGSSGPECWSRANASERLGAMRSSPVSTIALRAPPARFV
jgi:hypothetical protein